MTHPPLVRAVRKAQWHLLPFLILLYIVSYLDRINVSFAALTMNQDIGLSQFAFGFGSGAFFLGYFIFEVPSNLILTKVGPRLWIARIMISWGLVTMAMVLAAGPTSFAILRFLLGLAEAGFFPGLILYLTYWFPQSSRAKAVALFMTATPLAGLIGSPISGWLLGLHGLAGLAGWQWLFLLEGFPAVLFGILVLGRLPGKPQDASWLSDEERHALVEALGAEDRAIACRHLSGLRDGLVNPKVWLGGWIYFCMVVAMYGLVMWLPQIIAQAAKGTGLMGVSLLVMVTYACAMVGMIAIGASSDRCGERRRHVMGALGLCLVGMLLLGAGSGLGTVLAGASLAAMGIWGMIGPFWSLGTTFLTGQAAAAGIALINSLGNLGGFVGPFLMGALKTRTGDFTQAFLLIALLIAVSMLSVVFLRPPTAATVSGPAGEAARRRRPKG